MNMIIITAFIVLLVTLIMGVPVPFAFFASSIIIVFMGGYDQSFLLPYGFAKGSSIILCAIPLFILAGGIIEETGIGEKLVDWIGVIAARVKGGLGVVAVIACGFFGSISGSGAATITCIGSIMLPRMYAAGYPKGFSTALIANAGVLGLLIPPSLTMIMYAWIAGASILSCFLATVIPGIILIILFSITNLIYLKKNPEIITGEKYDIKTTGKIFAKRTLGAIPAIIAPIIILGGIYSGFMTPTEAAAISCVYAIPVGIFVYRNLSTRSFYSILGKTAITTGVIMFMIISVQILSRLYIMERVPVLILDILYSVSENRIIILLMINILLIVIGMLMDDASAILLCTPILLPVVAELGITPIHFAAIIGVNLGLANVTPPTAPFLYLACRVGNTQVDQVLKPCLYLIVFAWIPVLVAVTYFPAVALFLPNLLLG